jgi:hypothetical protein
VIARDGEHIVALVTEPFEEPARLLELLGLGALGQIAADDDEIGICPIDLLLDCLDHLGIVRSEMEVGEVNQARHGKANAHRFGWFNELGALAVLIE